jgi:hypothetical protein
MYIFKHNPVLALIALCGIFLLASACSKQNPVSSPTTRSLSHLSTTHDVDFEATVTTSDAATRTFTFEENAETVIVTETAEIRRHFETSPSVDITFEDISQGEFIRIRGNRQENGSVLADRVDVPDNDDNDDGDVEFHSVITSIDLVDSTITVSARAESILVDANTRIYGHVSGRSANATHDGDGDDGAGDADNGRDTVVSFESLSVGDSVEIHALVVDASTLLATRIELEDDMDDNEDIEFKDTLATVNETTRIVSFQNQSWIGVVDENAELRNLADQIVGLDAFDTDQLVEVKGLPRMGDTLLIVRMEMDNN